MINRQNRQEKQGSRQLAIDVASFVSSQRGVTTYVGHMRPDVHEMQATYKVLIARI